MEISYWQSRWRKNKTGWHLDQVYPPLIKYWPRLSLPVGARVLVPLCGKSRDIQWLANQGNYVIGVDASQKALDSLMEASPSTFTHANSYGYSLFRAKAIGLWQGNFLSFPQNAANKLDAIYDKAAIVALPAKMRKKYADKLVQLCSANTQLLLQSFEYNQQEMNGPPFSVPEGELRAHFAPSFDIELLYEESKFESVKKFQHRGLRSYFIEKVYHLTPK